MVWFPAGSVLLWPWNCPESPSIITVSFTVISCRLVHKPLKEKELHPPGSAETHIREETSEADRLLTWREWSEEFPTMSASYLTAQVNGLVFFITSVFIYFEFVWDAKKIITHFVLSESFSFILFVDISHISLIFMISVSCLSHQNLQKKSSSLGICCVQHQRENSRQERRYWSCYYQCADTKHSLWKRNGVISCWICTIMSLK